MEISNRSFYGMRAAGFYYGTERTRTNTAGSFARQAAEAAEEVGVNGLGTKKNGMLSHISQMLVQQVINAYNGKPNPQDILGSTVQSALNAAKKALYALENPLRPTGQRSPEVQQMVKKEKEFYKVFISKLSGLPNG